MKSKDWNQTRNSQQPYDELEQYVHILCFRIDSAPKQNNEKVEDVFKFVKGFIEEIPEVLIHKAHKIGPDYTHKKCRLCNSLSFFALQRSVIVQHLTELEGL